MGNLNKHMHTHILSYFIMVVLDSQALHCKTRLTLIPGFRSSHLLLHVIGSSILHLLQAQKTLDMLSIQKYEMTSVLYNV